ncbi:choice-of-anchor B family protein [Rubrivirga sp. IMCC43871]|uniref:choice-of-anchor B family protein n=1 Tax=Rubrivirga sp. IMCC43871 TaxID=3391575 RepID=UPI00398FC171
MPFRFSLVALAALLVAVSAEAQTPRAACQNGVATLADVGAFPCDRVDLVGYLSVGSFATPGSPAADGNNDIWGWTDPQTGVEYALAGTYNGLGIVDLSDPAFPRLVGKIPTANELNPVWRDVKVYADHAFIVADAARDHGVQIFDLNRLRSLSGDAVTLQPDAVYTGIRSAHNIVINEASGFAYAVGFRYPSGERASLGLPPSCDLPGFHAIDVRDPKNPVFAGCFSDAALETGPRSRGYTHDAQCLIYSGPDTDHTGKELCFGANEDVVTVFDVTDKANVQILSQAAYPNFSYTHQGWLTTDQRYFMTDDELDEINGLTPSQRSLVIDFQDLDDPEFAFAYNSGITTIDHNQYVRGDYAYQSNYESGLRIVDLRQIDGGQLTEAAFFDTYPDSDVVSFNGQWSNYPYFESGLVIANDDTYGLFVLRPDPAVLVASGEGPDLPQGYTLTAPRPNPAAGVSRLSLTVDTAQTVVAGLYDVAGRLVADLYSGPVSSNGPLTLAVDAASVPAGVYIVRIVGDRFETSRRVVLTR